MINIIKRNISHFIRIFEALRNWKKLLPGHFTDLNILTKITQNQSVI